MVLSRFRASGFRGFDLCSFVHGLAIGNEQVQGQWVSRLRSVLVC